MNEIWKKITGFEDRYEVSNLGRIRCLRDNHKNPTINIVKPVINKQGYGIVYFRKTDKKITLKVHRLVAMEFIENLENKPTINHIDGNKENNRVDNLEWMTFAENISHAHKIGLINHNKKKGEFHHNFGKHWEGKKGKHNVLSKRVSQYDLEGNLVKIWDSLSDIGRETKFSTGTISSVCTGNKYRITAYGFKWNYIF